MIKKDTYNVKEKKLLIKQWIKKRKLSYFEKLFEKKKLIEKFNMCSKQNHFVEKLKKFKKKIQNSQV